MLVTPKGGKLRVFRYRVDGKEKKLSIQQDLHGRSFREKEE